MLTNTVLFWLMMVHSDWYWLMLIGADWSLLMPIDAYGCWLMLMLMRWVALMRESCCGIVKLMKSQNSSGTWLRLVLLAEERRRWGTFTEASLFSCFLRSRVATRSRGWVVNKRGRCCIACQQCKKYFQGKVFLSSVKSVLKLPRINISLLKFTPVTVKDEMSFYCILSI